ncbi:beta-phosphoglucomutase [Enterococcus nangangensis]|uniref:beta-phosphoglucomutase n=1 Tax=Enterococcus nangangensis TaxID=2559926 RepID=UPI0010F625B1|nr:beta-phosphoglucomutase [Enterococcus nangangensis]
MKKYHGALFDLDGVLVDTAKYHFLAWQELAQRLEIPFTLADNERLKGVSRMASLEILLSLGRQTYSVAEKTALAEEKNQRYVALIEKMTPAEVLPGARQLLKDLHAHGVKIALGSASKNAPLILAKTELAPLFDEIVDGNLVHHAKPDPEVFLVGAEKLSLTPADCVVFEDAAAGIAAAKAGKMFAVGVGNPEILKAADHIVPDLAHFDFHLLF